MRLSDQLSVAWQIAKRNWKSLVVITVALISVIFIMIMTLTVGYNMLRYYDNETNELYLREGATLSIIMNVSNAEQYDANMAELTPYIINNMDVDSTATSGVVRCNIGANNIGLVVKIDKRSGANEIGKAYLSALDKITCEKNLGVKLNVGDAIPMSVTVHNIGVPEDIDIPGMFYAGTAPVSSMDVTSVRGEYLTLAAEMSIGVDIHFAPTMKRSEMDNHIDKFVKGIPDNVNISSTNYTISAQSEIGAIALMVFIIIAVIVILGMVSISIISGHLHMQITKDANLFAILRTSGMTKTKLALVEFIPLIAVIVLSTVVASLIMFGFLGVISDILGLILSGSLQNSVIFTAKYAAWIPFVCGGSMLVILMLNIPKFASKFRTDKMLNIIREREV